MNAANHPVGHPIPPFTEHAISVSLPTWDATVGYEENDPNIVNVMQTGYPRFFIHLSIQKLARFCEQKYGSPTECAILVPSSTIAEECRSFLEARSVPARIVQIFLPNPTQWTPHVHAILFPAESFPVAKQFWQHTGLGISSRLAEHCLNLIAAVATPPGSPTLPIGKAGNKHYGAKPRRNGVPLATSPPAANGVNGQSNSHAIGGAEEESVELFEKDHSMYLEERYGRNLNMTAASSAKVALRRRLAGLLVSDGAKENAEKEVEAKESLRGVAVTEGDVYLYPTGMAAIWTAHQLTLKAIGERKSVCFGFPYTDTLKILEKWGPGCYFLGHGTDDSVDELESILSSQRALDPSTPPILALFTEFPSNPLLRSADLPRLRKLADEYDFLIVVDDTLGNLVNVQVLPYADVVATSLTKIFSGESNVMGGSLVLNPARKYYAALRATMESNYEDFYFDEDAIFMERNSRDFSRRVDAIDANTAAVCDFLHSTIDPSSPSSVITKVHYPKYECRKNYDACRIPTKEGGEEGGFGSLFSISFRSLAASRGFFDTLDCFKGPSLGTNFTLACPYAVLAHYAELDWAEKWGVPKGLIRVSVGLEGREVLMDAVKTALKAAEKAHAEAGEV